MSAPPQTLDLTYFATGFVTWCALFSLTRRASKDTWAAYAISYRDQWEWLTRCISIVHAAFVSWFALPWLFTLWHAPAFVGSLPSASMVVSVSISFFTFDLVLFSFADYRVALKWKQAAEFALAKHEPVPKRPYPIGGAVYIAHHFFAAVGCFLSLHFQCMPVALAVGIAFEVTTPFLNAIWLTEQTRTNSGALYYAVGYAFLAFWVVFRLGASAWCLYELIATWQAAAAVLPGLVMAFFAVAVPGFNALNWFWFYKIVAKAMRPPKQRA